MQLESLRYFIELARAGSFYGAAKSSFISQQGLNKAITSLEQEVGVKLVERTRRGVRLTSEGEVFLRHARNITGDYDAMVDDLVAKQVENPEGDEPISLHVSYYAAQTAVGNLEYIGMLAERSSYVEEPFDKLIAHAENSDGSDLSYLDVHAHSLDEVRSNPKVLFEPIVKTRYGFVWKEGSSLASERLLHREDVAAKPMALDSFREMRQLADRLFRNHPLENVRMEVTSPRMLLSYVQSSDYDAVAGFDSFGFYLSQKDPSMPTEGLHFTPLSTPESISLVGFLYPRNAKLSMRARHSVSVLKRFLAENCADYYVKNPLD